MRLKPLFLLIFLPVMAWGQLGNFVNPGPLSNPHKSLDGLKNCTQCHSASQGVPNEKCLDCHPEIQKRLQARQGYHARKLGQCASCHSEHKGRDYDVTGLSRLNFNHIDTGWPLTGKHRQAECKDCHTTKRKGTNRTTYLEADADCASCHLSESPHKTQKKKFQACQKCHGTSDWSARDRMQFNHNTETRYPLTGNHAKVDCFSCHTNKVWAPKAHAQCSDCHADPHNGSFGPKCSDCHTSTVSWTSSSSVTVPSAKASSQGFDHSKTQFPLQGRHRSVSCKKCHGSTIGKMPKINFRDCKGCHPNPHNNQFQQRWTPKTCKSCHSTLGFQNLNKFKHNEDSRYELLGQHRKVECNKCHAGGKYRWLSQTPDCDECHADVHNGQYEPQPCSSCHNFDGFKKKQFDHSKTRFPLVGKHKAVACNDCHSSGQYKGLDTSCNSCHADYHDGQLSKECETCHAPTGFKDVEFDHNRQARFRIDGKHKENTCNQCHWGGKYKFEEVRCATCHYDVHNGAHGKECDRCHTTSGFKMTEGFHEFGEYQLGGIHNQMECSQCHNPKAPIRIDSTQCSSCHRDPHMNSLGNRCYECHNQISWHPTTFRHNQTGFDLTGAHRFLDCSSCHFNRVFGGLPSECYFCHFKDFDASLPQHVGGSTDCASCHFTFGFRPAKP
jgi:hypothetical protein